MSINRIDEQFPVSGTPYLIVALSPQVKWTVDNKPEEGFLVPHWFLVHESRPTDHLLMLGKVEAFTPPKEAFSKALDWIETLEGRG